MIALGGYDLYIHTILKHLKKVGINFDLLKY